MFEYIQKAKLIVGIYLGLKLTQLGYSLFIMKEPTQVVTGRAFVLIIPALLAIFAFKNNKF